MSAGLDWAPAGGEGLPRKVAKMKSLLVSVLAVLGMDPVSGTAVAVLQLPVSVLVLLVVTFLAGSAWSASFSPSRVDSKNLFPSCAFFGLD